MFQLTDEQIEGVARYKASYLPVAISAGLGFRPAVRKHVSDLQELGSPEVCARRRELFKLALADAEFRERIVFADGSRVVIGGIRFQHLNVAFPFVELNASFDLIEPRILRHVATIARQQFPAFAPKGVLVVGAPVV